MNIKITPGLKITETAVTIVGFKRLPTYSYANDPNVLLTKGLTDSARTGADLRNIADNQRHLMDTSMSNNRGSEFAGTWDQFSDNAMKTTAMYSYSDHHSPAAIAGSWGPPPESPTAPTTSMNTEGASGGLFGGATRDLNIGISEVAANNAASAAEAASQVVGKIATQGMDAMDVEFDVRSAKMLHNPYVVTMTRFRTPGMKPGQVQNLIYAHSLHPIDEHSSHVHFVEEGFPFNYELVDFQLHLYNHGEEIATNIASDRIELTRDEAFEYLKMEYVGAHQGATLPPLPMMGKLPYDLPLHLAAGKYRDAIYVRVSKEGSAFEAFSDPGCSQKIVDDYLDGVVQRIRFKPALANGKPVAGTATLNLARLKI